MHTAIIRRSFDASPERVFAFMASHEKFGAALAGPIGSKLNLIRRVFDGQGTPDGVGSIRRIGFGPAAIEETIVISEPNSRIEYIITKGGAPVKNHHGIINLTPTSRGGTAVDYRITFDCSIPGIGGFIALALEKAIGAALKRMDAAL